MKKITLLLAAAALTISMAIPALAGEWKQTDGKWWYQNDDGGYPASTWQWIDADGDGIAHAYYFDADGYLVTNACTPDNCYVNGNGEWECDGVVQCHPIASAPAATAPETAAPEAALPQEPSRQTPAPQQSQSSQSVQAGTSHHSSHHGSSHHAVGSDVWLSATGTKYHCINNCGNMNPNKARRISYEEAVSGCYERCTKCY